jgi:hypothetical protein
MWGKAYHLQLMSANSLRHRLPGEMSRRSGLCRFAHSLDISLSGQRSREKYLHSGNRESGIVVGTIPGLVFKPGAFFVATCAFRRKINSVVRIMLITAVIAVTDQLPGFVEHARWQPVVVVITVVYFPTEITVHAHQNAADRLTLTNTVLDIAEAQPPPTLAWCQGSRCQRIKLSHFKTTFRSKRQAQPIVGMSTANIWHKDVFL